MTHRTRGFTLIELLVVIAIIGMLSSIVLASLNSSRAKARDAKRISDLQQLQTALEQYYNDNGAYPSTGSVWFGVCGTTAGVKTTSGASGYIPNLAPTYIPVLPTDPKPDGTAWDCYIYYSNGVDYMLLAYYTVETFTSAKNPWYRPAYPTQPDFAVYSPGATNW